MDRVYICTLKVEINQKGLTYNISFSNPPTIYKENGYMGRLSSGYVYKIQDMKIIDENSNIINLSKAKECKRFYPSKIKSLNKNTQSNNYTLDYTYKKFNRALIKGIITLNIPIQNALTIDVYEIDLFEKEVLLGSTFSDIKGNYFINFPIKNNRSYKLVASYMSLK